MSSRKTIMDDIANMAGVTKSMVSRYFNGGSAKESTRERVQEVMRGYNHESNTFARLRAKGSNVTEVVLPTPNSKMSSRVVISAGHYLREQEHETLVKDLDHSVGLELKSIQRLITLKVDGIILNAITIIKAHRNLIQESPMPVVVAAQEYDGGVPIVHDDYRAGKAVGVHVGRVAPAWVGYMGVFGLDMAVGFNRKQGVMDGLKEYGVKNVVTTTGGYSYASRIRMVEEILDQGPVNAIIYAIDHLAFGAYHILGGGGLRTPEDVSVAGFGGYDEGTLLKPELTALHLDSYGSDYLGTETTLKIIHRELVPKKQIADYKITEGGSTKK